MNWRTACPLQHAEDWADLERTLGRLPPSLAQQALVLTGNLSILYSPTGLLRDILTRPGDYGLLYAHDWLIHDWQIDLPATVSRHLFLSASYNVMAGYSAMAQRDRDTPLTADYAPLQTWLAQQAMRHNTLLFAEASPYWIDDEACRSAAAAAQLQETEDWFAHGGTWQTDYATHLKDRLAPFKLNVCGAALLARQSERLPQLQRLLDALHIALQLRAEIVAVRRDLNRRRFTYPIIHALLAVHIDPRGALNPDRILGAMLLSGSLRQVCADALAYAAEARTLAHDLNLPTFETYLTEHRDELLALQDLFTLGQTPNPDRPTPSLRPAIDSLPTVINMAEKFLLADRTFAESWEVQRRGPQDLISKAFPTGLIAEILGQHDHHVTDVIDEVFRTLHGSGFRYYTSPIGLPDTDDLGLLLRLLRYSDRSEEHRQMLRTPLNWLKNSIAADGLIPVWLTTPEEAQVRVWGNHCATVAANLLLGVLDNTNEVETDLIDRAAAHWLTRWQHDGLGANAYYVPAYALWTTVKLLTQLAVCRPPWQTEIEAATQQAITLLAHDTRRATLTPQTAAFLILSTAYPATRHLFDAGWITYLLKTQRYDGSWRAEALYLTPTRGEFAAWYASRTVTTAFCYHALATVSG